MTTLFRDTSLGSEFSDVRKEWHTESSSGLWDLLELDGRGECLVSVSSPLHLHFTQNLARGFLITAFSPTIPCWCTFELLSILSCHKQCFHLQLVMKAKRSHAHRDRNSRISPKPGWKNCSTTPNLDPASQLLTSEWWKIELNFARHKARMWEVISHFPEVLENWVAMNSS